MRHSVIPIALLWGALLAVAPARAAIDDDARRAAADKLSGTRTYQSLCVSCHGPAGAGNGPAATGLKVPDFTTPQAVVTFELDRMLKGIEGRHDKALRDGWAGKLTEADTRNVVAYMREAFMLPAPTADASRGRAIFAKTCSVCHGDRGNAATWAKNSLNPSPFDFTSPKAKELSRRHMINTVTYGSPKTAMIGFSTQMSREDIAAVVDYIRTTFVFPEGIPGNDNSAGERLSYGNRMLNATGDHGGGGGKHAQHGGHAGPADMSAPFPNGLAGDAKAGKRFFENNCYVCHGKDGKGDGPRAYFIRPKPANLTAPEARVELNRPHLFKSIQMGSIGTEMPAWGKVLSEQEIANIAEHVFTTFISVAEPTTPVPVAAPEQKKNR